MAQRIYSIDLQDTLFPMLSEQQGRTIIGGTVGESPSRENKPGIAYCHNVMPNEYGFESVGFLSSVPAITELEVGETVLGQRIIYGDERTRVTICWTTLGKPFVLFPDATSWERVVWNPPLPVPFTLDAITVGTVDGVSYINVATGTSSRTHTFDEDAPTPTLQNKVLSGLDETKVLGVVGSSGYLVTYTKNALAWSSTIEPTDFVPSAVTGAGGANVAGIAGDILFGTHNSLGILLYTRANVIAGTYTGNPKFPFKFREVDNSKGGINLDRIAYDANAKAQFVYSKAGLQSITSQRAENMLPFVTDFLAGRRFEDYNETTKLYEITNLAIDATMLKKVRYVASRYLVISYGVTSFTHALVFDTSLQKLGKIKIDHEDVFDFVGLQSEISKETLAFLLDTGEVQIVDFSSTSVGNGVIILGKLQVSRTRFLDLLGIEVENVDIGASLDVSSQVSLDGKTFTIVEATLKDSDTNIREYDFRSEAMSHSLAFTGKFNLVTVQITYKVGGRR